MFEIIPNWHPIFVHFTVALLSLAAGLFVVTPFLRPPLQEQWRTVARWSLWFGAGFAVITGLTGLYAYNTVNHDTPSHAAMTEHRNWALATITLFLVMAVWSALRVRRRQALGAIFSVAMVVAAGVLAATAWRGGELVYRYGLGVMSLPKAEGEGHHHEHAAGSGHDPASEAAVDSGAMATATDHHDADHEHDADHGHDERTAPGRDAAADHHDDDHDAAH